MDLSYLITKYLINIFIENIIAILSGSSGIVFIFFASIKAYFRLKQTKIYSVYKFFVNFQKVFNHGVFQEIERLPRDNDAYVGMGNVAKIELLRQIHIIESLEYFNLFQGYLFELYGIRDYEDLKVFRRYRNFYSFFKTSWNLRSKYELEKFLNMFLVTRRKIYYKLMRYLDRDGKCNLIDSRYLARLYLEKTQYMRVQLESYIDDTLFYTDNCAYYDIMGIFKFMKVLIIGHKKKHILDWNTMNGRLKNITFKKMSLYTKI